jgi:hypothetical protein
MKAKKVTLSFSGAVAVGSPKRKVSPFSPPSVALVHASHA